jgi:hypothetical protein
VTTGVLTPVAGSTIEAMLKPISWPTISPATRTATSTMCSVNASASPMTTSRSTSTPYSMAPGCSASGWPWAPCSSSANPMINATL